MPVKGERKIFDSNTLYTLPIITACFCFHRALRFAVSTGTVFQSKGTKIYGLISISV